MSYEDLNFEKAAAPLEQQENCKPFPFESKCNQYSNKSQPNNTDVTLEPRYGDINHVLIRIGSLDFFVHVDWLKPHSVYWERRLEKQR